MSDDSEVSQYLTIPRRSEEEFKRGTPMGKTRLCRIIDFEAERRLREYERVMAGDDHG